MKIVTKKISYGNTRQRDLERLVKFENTLKNKSYQMIPRILKENGKEFTLVEFRIND